jgi:hypothetical protein
MTTRWEVAEAPKQLTPECFIYLQDGPRQGETLLAPGHTGKICVGLVANQVPRLGSELIYAPTTVKTADGSRVYRLVVPGRLEASNGTTDA